MAKRTAKPKKPRKVSSLEATFHRLWEIAGDKNRMPEREFHFAKPRMWRFDAAWPKERVAVELEGGCFTNGGHNRGKAFHDNCEKYNRASELGWRLLRFTTKHLKEQPVQCIEQIIRVLNDRAKPAQQTDTFF